jgi:hypothetical protein
MYVCAMSISEHIQKVASGGDEIPFALSMIINAYNCARHPTNNFAESDRKKCENGIYTNCSMEINLGQKIFE